MYKIKTFHLIVIFIFIGGNCKAQLKVLSGGRVGIGTNDVNNYKLHVVGDQYVQALRITSSAGAWGYASRVQTANGSVKCFAGGTF